MTNYEKIKQMSIDELADWMSCPFDLSVTIRHDFKGNCEIYATYKCNDCCKRYLESEVSDTEGQEK